ncbi:MAG: DUF881 domain-containing protein [Actinobacteria bacterium]|nr:DUF881 domain-containing protein [Actinomycetota bacterium]
MTKVSTSKNRKIEAILLGTFVFISMFLLVLLAKNISGIRPIRQNKDALISRIRELEQERAKYKKTIEELNKQIGELERKTASSDRRVKELKRQLDLLREEVGMTAIIGKGVEVTLKDAEVSGGLIEEEQAVVHDSDLRLLVNGLFLGGARAVSINGERITSVSSIRCVGPTILVNSKRISSPFVVKAIGDPESLIDGLYEEPTLNYYITQLFPEIGIGFSVKKKDDIRIPAYKGNLSFSKNLVRVAK